MIWWRKCAPCRCAILSWNFRHPAKGGYSVCSFTASSLEAEARGASLASKTVNKGQGEDQYPRLLSSDLLIGTVVCVHAHTHACTNTIHKNFQTNVLENMKIEISVNQKIKSGFNLQML